MSCQANISYNLNSSTVLCAVHNLCCVLATWSWKERWFDLNIQPWHKCRGWGGGRLRGVKPYVRTHSSKSPPTHTDTDPHTHTHVHTYLWTCFFSVLLSAENRPLLSSSLFVFFFFIFNRSQIVLPSSCFSTFHGTKSTPSPHIHLSLIYGSAIYL